MAEEATIMAEEMQSPKKVAFANRKYSNEDKRKMEEEELEQMLKEQKGEVEETVEAEEDRKSTRLNSSHGYISYAVFCLKKKKKES